ncbi:MAG: hypothetical protein AAF393_03020 [Pseudomonadota bacterium]
MKLANAALTITLMIAAPATAQPLADMGGTWRGSGWARQTPDGPQETIRCRITNTYDTATLTLSVKGQCAVPGRKLTLSGTLVGQDGSEKITGRWSNPDGLGRTKVSGVQRDGLVAFTFRAKDPATGDDLAQNIVWRLFGDTLRLRATDRADPAIKMSEIEFTR